MLKQSKNTEVAVFGYGNKEVRSLMINQEPWFVGLDVCDVLGLKNPRQSLSTLDEDEKLTSVIRTSGQRREVAVINESGVYHLIFRSNKPEAKAFRKWVTAEVLPAIRKQGTYTSPAKYREQAIQETILKAKEVAGSMRALSQRIGYSDASISRIMTGHIGEYADKYLDELTHACKQVVYRPMLDVKLVEDVLQIEDGKLRNRIYTKLKKGGLL